VGEEMICHFGKHEGVAMGEIPTGYLRWAVKTIDPMPLPQYRKNEDGSPKTAEEVKAMETAMREFLNEAEREIARREEDGEEKG